MSGDEKLELISRGLVALVNEVVYGSCRSCNRLSCAALRAGHKMGTSGEWTEEDALRILRVTIASQVM